MPDADDCRAERPDCHCADFRADGGAEPLVSAGTIRRAVLPEISWQARKDDALTPDYDLGYTGFPTKSAVDLRRIIHEARNNLCAVTCPVLCVQSSGDQVITPDSADVILQGVRSKTKGVLRLESVPHVCTISREGTRIAQALGTFFREAEESERT